LKDIDLQLAKHELKVSGAANLRMENVVVNGRPEQM
jgi:hypothetical protein